MNYQRAIFSEAIDTLLKNKIIAIPTITVSLLMVLITMLMSDGTTPNDFILQQTTPIEQQDKVFQQEEEETVDFSASSIPIKMNKTQLNDFLKFLFKLFLINSFLVVFSIGMVLSMYNDLLHKGECSLQTGFRNTISNLNKLMLSAFIIATLFIIGMFLYLLPGFVVLFIFMYTFVLIIHENTETIHSLKQSVQIIKENFRKSFLIFIALFSAKILLEIIDAFLFNIPFIGIVGSAIMEGFFLSLACLVLYKTYLSLKRNVTVII